VHHPCAPGAPEPALSKVEGFRFWGPGVTPAPVQTALSCDPETTMKLLLLILVALAFAASFLADYKWRKWIAEQKRQRQGTGPADRRPNP